VETSEEKKDEVVKALPVAIATSPPEAAALVAALEAAGIPTHLQNTPQRGYGMDVALQGSDSLHKTILVPSDRVLEAENVVNAFLLEAKREGVRRAFLPEEIEDLARNPRPGPEMMAARELKDAPEEERAERLSEFVATWLTVGDSEVRIAQRLAAAGLTEAQATELVLRVVRERADLFEGARRKQVVAGVGIVLGGLVWMAINGILHSSHVSKGTSATGGPPSEIDVTGRVVMAAVVAAVGILVLVRARYRRNPVTSALFPVTDEPLDKKPS
jgi:hypothetical protein